MERDPTVLLNISEMIDLAIGTPEVGVVDFGMLQMVLHCLAQQQRVLDKNVELRGSVGAMPLGREKQHTIDVKEYIVDTDESVPLDAKTTKRAERFSVPAAPSIASQDTVLVVERVKKADLPQGRTPAGRPYSPPVAVPPGDTGPAYQPPRSASTEKLSLVTMSKFNILEGAVEDLKNRVYGSIPTNENLLEEVRSQSNLKSITDMWTSLNVSTRLEAAEAGIGKLSSLMQDMIVDSQSPESGERRASKPPPPSVPTIHIAEPESAPTAAVSTVTGVESAADAETDKDLQAFKAQLARLRNDLENLTNNFFNAFGGMPSNLDVTTVPVDALSQAPTQMPSEAPTQRPSKTPTQRASGAPLQDNLLYRPDATTATSKADRRNTEFASIPVTPANLMERVNELERRLNKCCESVDKSDGVVQDQLTSFQDQLEHLAKELARLTEDLAAGKLSPDLVNDLQGLMTLFTSVQDMQDQMKQVNETARQLAAEKNDRQRHMDALIEQIELLKNIKLDREDMAEAMAEKADLRMLARKVSHDQFEMACDDLSRGVENALGKLNMQEALWQQALDDIQREIETKLDKMELSPVKEFFNTKLKQLQENLKKIAALRKQTEAAGTKRRLLQDVNCISCDANAVMPMDAQSAVPVLRALAPNLSMKPYLSYELDAIRKTQATHVPQRNLHDWEQIEKQATQKQLARPKSEGDKHLCNRYCGGSHTITTAAQRVARLGHFVRQWGPDVVPLSSGMAAGDDGRLYKVSTGEGAAVGPTDGGGAAESTCTPKPGKKVESLKPHKLTISSECRCLEGDKH